MEDRQIVALYWQRNEQAIQSTADKYGRFLHSMAFHILANNEDAEECVNDTYIGAWNAIPPHRPNILSAFLAKLTRRISLDRLRRAQADKRGGSQVPLALEELSECVASGTDVVHTVEMKEIASALRRFLAALPETQRDIFVARYFYLTPIDKLSQAFGFSESKVKSMLFRIRGRLKKQLQEEELL